MARVHPGPFAIAVEPAQRRLAALRLAGVRFAALRFADVFFAGLALGGALRLAAFLAAFFAGLALRCLALGRSLALRRLAVPCASPEPCASQPSWRSSWSPCASPEPCASQPCAAVPCASPGPSSPPCASPEPSCAAFRCAFFAGGTVTTFLESSHSREVRTSRVFTRRVRECGLTPYVATSFAPGL